jgi:hypothetical protein
MTEPNQTHAVLTTLRDALHTLDATIERTREGVNAIITQTERLQANVETFCALRQREATPVGIDMVVDAAADLLAAFRELESGLLDAQADIDLLESEMTDDDTDRAP